MVIVRSVAVVTIAVLLATAACGDSKRQQAEGERRTASLVVGSSAAEWGVLTIPRPGGVPDLRPVVSPDSVVWSGTTELPLATGVWALGDQKLVLRTDDGSLLRYDPVTDAVSELDRVAPGARPVEAGGSAIVFLDLDAGTAYEVGGDFDRLYELPNGVTWAGSVEGGLAALGDDGRLWLIPRADSDSTATVERADVGRPPAFVTAWGRRLVVTGPDGRSIRVFSAEGEADPVGEAEVDGVVRALSASPSSHEIYAVVGDPPRLERVSRFSFDVERVADLPASSDRLRPGLFGGSVMAGGPSGAVRVPVGDDEAAPLAGEWRADLPIGLPGDLSIVSVGDEAHLVSAVDTGGVALAGGEPRWWIPVRFNPAIGRPEELERALDELGAVAEGDTTTPDARADAGDVGGEDVEVPEVPSEGGEGASGPPGYYAIVTSARQRAGVEELTASLSDAGYPTRIQTYPDEAGEVWHRGLVGPFPSRARAQAAARQLLRERGLQAWVTEIGATE